MAKNTGKNGSTPLSAIGVALAAQNVNSLMPSSNNQVDLLALQKWLIKPNEKVIAEGVPETKRILEQAKNMGRPNPVTIEEMQAEKASMREFQKQREAAQRQQELLKKTAGSQKGNPVSMFLPTYGSEADLTELEGALIKATPIAMENRTEDARGILSQRHGRPATIEELQAEKASMREFQRQQEENKRRQELMDKANNSYTGSGTSSTLPRTNGKTNVPDIEGALIKPNPIAMENRTEDARGILSQRHGRPATIEELQAEKASMREFQGQREENQRWQELLDKSLESYTGPGTMPRYAGNESQMQGPFIINDETIANGTQNAKEILEQTKDRPITNIESLDLSFLPSFKDFVVEPLDLSLEVMENFSKSGAIRKAAKVGGKALTIVSDVYDITAAVSADLTDSDKKIGKKTAAAVGGAASSAVFGALGAAAFSILAAGAAGALMGSVIPGPGTIVGFIGGLVGGMIGAAAGEEFSDWVINQIDWDE